MAGNHGGARQGAGRPIGKVSAAKQAIAEAAKDHGEAMLQVLVQIAQDPEQPASARVSAANAVIERGYGKPVAPKEHGVTDTFAEALKEISRRGSVAPIAT